MTGSLFNLEFDRDRFRDRLRTLAARHIYIGGSSWKYEGWLGQIYSPDLYRVRGRFAKKLFEQTCLSEYAAVFPAVCGDFSFYGLPRDPGAFWVKLFRQTPDTFRWGFKIPEQITVPVWPVHPRYGALAGKENPAFLDLSLFQEGFLKTLEPHRDRVGVLIFEFGALHRGLADFLKVLEPFLACLPAVWKFAIEIRNAEFLAPDYFACLRAHGVTHVYNAWARMPEIAEQMAIPQSDTSELIVARALLRRGRPYEQAVQEFAPYDRVREVNEPVRRGLRELIDIARVDGRPADNGVDMHPAFEGALSKMYGYTSDADGIRHALVTESTLDADDARFSAGDLFRVRELPEIESGGLGSEIERAGGSSWRPPSTCSVPGERISPSATIELSMAKVDQAPQLFHFQRSKNGSKVIVLNSLSYVMAEYDETTGVTRWTRVVPAAQRENVQQWLLKTYPVVVEVPTPARRKKAA